MKNGADARRMFWPLALAWVGLDQLTKRWAESTLLPYEPVAVVGDWMRWRLAYNPGAAFSLHLGPYSRWIFAGIATLAVVGIAWKARDADWNDWLRQFAAALVVGGAAGNLMDQDSPSGWKVSQRARQPTRPDSSRRRQSARRPR